MPDNSFVPSGSGKWFTSRVCGSFYPRAAEVPASAPPPKPADPLGAARRLLRAFRRVERANPNEWRMRIALASGYSGVSPIGRTGCWWLLGSAEVHEEPRLFFTALPAEVPGVARLCRELRRCRRLAKRLDPTDARGAVLAQLVARILAARWAVGVFEPLADGNHRIAVAYPTELLTVLAEWIDAAPKRAGRKPDPLREPIAKRSLQMRAERRRWKDVVKEIEAEFGVLIKAESLRRMCGRAKRPTKTGTQ